MDLNGKLIESNVNISGAGKPAVLGEQDLACVGGGSGQSSETYTPRVLSVFDYPGALDVRSTAIVNNQWIERL